MATPGRGVPHASEIPFVFGTYDDAFFAPKVGAGAGERALSERMLADWAEFAHEGRVDQTAAGTGVETSFAYGTEREDARAVARRLRGKALQAWGL